MTSAAPGSYVAAVERWGELAMLLNASPSALVVVDEKVLRLHSHLAKPLARHRVVKLRAKESTKSLATLHTLAEAAGTLPRGTRIVAIGGGTIGDVVTVFAHLHKRGATLIQVPTTLVAAVDSSVGGKGALNAAGHKNSLGVFHAASEAWLCLELFSTLRKKQLLEGHVEAFKTALVTDAPTWRHWTTTAPSIETMLKQSRRLKGRLCHRDPYDAGPRAALNFGHTLGHAIEAVTHYRVSHGTAIALGTLCALDVGRALKVTSEKLAHDVEAKFPLPPHARLALRDALVKHDDAELLAALAGDKKGGDASSVNFVLLEAAGKWRLHRVPHRTWKALAKAWRRGERP